MARSFTEHEKDNIRNHLQEACKQSWTQYGYKKTSVDDLCRQTGISKGAFYLFFESKEALFCEVLCSVQEQICRAASEVIEKHRDKHGVAEALKLIYREYDKNNFLYESDSTDFTILMNRLSEEQAKKIQNAENTLSQSVKVIEKQDKIIAEKNAAIMKKHSVLEDVTMKLAEVETLVDEVAEQAYEKACEAVANTVRQETQKEDIKILDDYSRWLSAPERTADKKLRDYAVKRLGALKEKLIKSAKATVQKVTDSLQEPEHRQKNLEQVREKARESIKDRLARGKTEADRLNRERMERIRPTIKKDMEI